MRGLYLFSVWLHILAAMTWAGGMFFLVLVMVPWLRRGDRARAAEVLHETGLRFRTVGWVAFAVLTATGSWNLWVRGVRWADFGRQEWLASPFGRAVLLKLAAFVLVLVISAVHDFRLGPRATRELRADPASRSAQRLRRAASQLGRLNLLLGLALVALGVLLVRG